MTNRPGGALATRPLHFFWVCDCSGSMQQDGKIQSLNAAIRDALPHMKQVADENPNADVLVRVLKFSNGASWQVGQAVKVSDFTWQDLSADGVTDLGRALKMLAEKLKVEKMPPRALPARAGPGDRRPADRRLQRRVRALLEEPWAKKAVRVAIAIGEDADLDVLQEFIGHPEIRPLKANNPEALVRYIKWVSTAVVGTASQPKNTGGDGPAAQQGNSAAPPLPPVPAPPSDPSAHARRVVRPVASRELPP